MASHSCCVIYSNKDELFAKQLYGDLRSNGVSCYFAPQDLEGGKKLHLHVATASRTQDRVLLILSDTSMSSNWVKSEISNARSREASEKRQMLFPISLAPFDHIRAWICLDGNTGISRAREIREYLILDFSNWTNPDSYRQALERLVRDLKKVW